MDPDGETDPYEVGGSCGNPSSLTTLEFLNQFASAPFDLDQ